MQITQSFWPSILSFMKWEYYSVGSLGLNGNVFPILWHMFSASSNLWWMLKSGIKSQTMNKEGENLWKMKPSKDWMPGFYVKEGLDCCSVRDHHTDSGLWLPMCLLKLTPFHTILETNSSLLSCFLHTALCVSHTWLLAFPRCFMYFHNPVVSSAWSVLTALVRSSVSWCLTDFFSVI